MIKILKKTIFIFIFVLFFVFSPYVYASEKTTFFIDNIKSSPGSEVTMSVKMENNPNFGMLSIKVLFDTSKLEYIDSEIVGLKKAMMKGAEQNKQGNIVLYAFVIDSNKPLTDTGEILRFKLKIKEEVTENIKVKVDVTDYGKDENTPLEYETKDGMIIVNDNVTIIDSKKDGNISLTEEIKEDNKDITWKSSDTSIATVDENGNVEFKKDGNVTITASKDDKTILSKDYYIPKKIKKKSTILKVFGIVGGIVLLFSIILVYKKKKKGFKI